jgi:hypothetical protein
MSDLKLLIHSRTRYRDTPIKKIKIGITMAPSRRRDLSLDIPFYRTMSGKRLIDQVDYVCGNSPTSPVHSSE